MKALPLSDKRTIATTSCELVCQAIALSTPFPQAGRLPVVVGGHGPRSLDVAAKHAQAYRQGRSRMA
jgi:hypothetical protein